MDEQCAEQIISPVYADFITEFDGDANTLKKLYQTDCVIVIDGLFAIFTAPQERMDALGLYAYHAVPKLYGLMDSTNMDSAGITSVQQQPNLNLTGQDVIVGIIDTGIDYTHPVFRNIDGSTRIAAIWDQSDESGMTPETFGYGSEYTSDVINQALRSENPYAIVPQRDTNGHGTFMAGIAAGNVMPEQDFTGAAPNAQLLVVKLRPAKRYLRGYYLIPDGVEAFQENDIMTAMYYMRQYAMQQQKPLSIYIGVGTNSGDHNGNSYLSSYINYFGDQRGMCVSVPVGNEGNRATHYAGRLTADALTEDVEFRVDDNEHGLVIELWGRAPDIYTIGLIAPGGEQIQKIQPRYDQVIEENFILEPAKVYIRYFLVESASGNQVILLRLNTPSAGIWKIRVYGERILYGDFNIWMPIDAFIRSGTYFLKPDPNQTITSPGDSLRSVNTTAYNHINQTAYIFSGRGYTPDGLIVPDIAAPGVNIFGPAPDHRYTRRSGTSVAAAHSAGAAALLLEWGIYKRHNMNIDSTEIKKLLIRGARRSLAMDYPNRIWGYGELDVYNVFLYVSIT